PAGFCRCGSGRSVSYEQNSFADRLFQFFKSDLHNRKPIQFFKLTYNTFGGVKCRVVVSCDLIQARKKFFSSALAETLDDLLFLYRAISSDGSLPPYLTNQLRLLIVLYSVLPDNLIIDVNRQSQSVFFNPNAFNGYCIAFHLE